MIESVESPVARAALGTLFTWAVTAAGSAVVFFGRGSQKYLDGSLGFAAGVMLAASYWSLLAPAIDAAAESGTYGAKGEWAFVPVAIGFAIGAFFVNLTETLLPLLGLDSPDVVTALTAEPASVGEVAGIEARSTATPQNLRQRKATSADSSSATAEADDAAAIRARAELSWRHTLLLALAVTMHNIPEGLAVGVGFGAIGSVASATFENARNLAIGIGIQNFPEGLAVSLPLHRAGFSKWKAFWYGQMSGMVEPVAGVLGAGLVTYMEPVLPYALSFAAGAMVFVVFDDIIPEVCSGPNSRVATWGAMAGFIVMMSLDVALG